MVQKAVIEISTMMAPNRHNIKFYKSIIKLKIYYLLNIDNC